MLDELRIRGLGVIDDAVLPLGPGLTVVTGETGAGKTMVVTGLLLLFGGRADVARVRTGAEHAGVDGRLAIGAQSPAAGRVRDAGGELDDDELVLRRVVSASGRSRAYVGGAPAPVSVLSELADSLLSVHGQSDQLRLARPAAQRVALDRYAGIGLAGYQDAFAQWRAAAAALAERTGRASELRRESDLLAHGLAEIDAVAPQPGEADELTALAARLGHADALTNAARTAHDALLGDATDPGGQAADVSQLLAAAARTAGQQRAADAELDSLADRLTELAALAADLGAEFGAYADNLEADPLRLEQVERRRAELGTLVRKYSDEPQAGLAGVHSWAHAARIRLAEIDVSDDAIAALRVHLDEAAAAAGAAAGANSAARRAAAQQLTREVTAELAGLAMPGAELQVAVTAKAPTGDLALVIDGVEFGASADGIDDVTFVLQAHPGSPALPLGRGASGGELSRVMLALEVCLAGTNPVPTLVFDEVDAGVGGRAAIEVGRRLARLARQRQVLVVTHLAQVAAFADRHIAVDKPAGPGADGVTASDVRVVTEDERVGELARMLAGSDSSTARDHARELLADASAQRREARPEPTRKTVGPSPRRSPKADRVPRGGS